MLESADQLRGDGPLDVASARYARDVEKVRMLGFATGVGNGMRNWLIQVP